MHIGLNGLRQMNGGFAYDPPFFIFLLDLLCAVCGIFSCVIDLFPAMEKVFCDKCYYGKRHFPEEFFSPGHTSDLVRVYGAEKGGNGFFFGIYHRIVSVHKSKDMRIRGGNEWQMVRARRARGFLVAIA